jgi:hypothetical protein
MGRSMGAETPRRVFVAVGESLGVELVEADRLHEHDFYKRGATMDPDYGRHWLYGHRMGRFEDCGPGYVATICGLDHLVGLHGDGFHVSPLAGGRPTAGQIRVLHLLMTTVAQRSGRRVILRRCPDPMAQALFASGLFVHRHRGNMEEDSYPETFLDIEGSLDIVRDPRSKWARKVRRFVRADLGIEELVGEEAAPHAMEALRSIGSNRGIAGAYEGMVRAAVGHLSSDVHLSVFLESETGRATGVYLAGELTDRAAGLYMGLTLTGTPGLTEYLDLQVLRSLRERYDEVHLGGAETSGVVRYIEKLGPQISTSSYFTLEVI